MRRPELSTVLCALAVLAGLVGAALLVEGRPRAVLAEGPFWSAVDRHDRPLRVQPGRRGLDLAPGERLRLGAPDSRAAPLRRLTARVRPSGGQSSQLEWRLREQSRGVLLLRVVPGDVLEAFLSTRLPDGREQQLADGRLARDGHDDGDGTLTLDVSLDGSRLVLEVDGHGILDHAGLPWDEGRTTLWADGLTVETLVVDHGDEHHEETFDAWADTATGGALSGLALGLTALGLAVLWCAALVRTARRLPDPATSLGGALRTLAPGALVVALAGWRPDAAAQDVTSLALAALALGLVWSARHVLRASRPLTDDDPGPGWVLPVAALVLLVVGTGGSFAEAGREAIVPVLGRVQRSLTDVDARAWSLDDERSLRRGVALSVPGVQYGLEIEADVTLERRSLLELRVRGADRLAAGMAFVLSTHPEVPSGFHIERDEDFGLAGRPAPAVASGRRKHLRLVVEASRFAAFVDGQRFASAYQLDAPAGRTTLLVPTGEVTVHQLRVTPIERPAELPNVMGYALRAALKPWLLVLLAAVLGHHLLRRRVLDLWVLLGLAAVPAAVACRFVEAGGHLSQTTWLLAVCGGLPLACLPVVCAPAGLGVGRRLSFVAVGVALALGLATAPLGPPARADRAAGPEIEDFAGPRLVPGLVHWQHPLVRRFNTWLREHRFRGRAVETPKPEDVLRVVCVGSSSTWGHGLPEGTGLDWPARLERELADAVPGRRVEVVNGAVRGSTTARMAYVLDEVLLGLEPDVVVLCFGFNDATALSVLDEATWLERFSAAGAHHDAWSRLALQRERERGERLLGRLWTQHGRLGRRTQTAWERVAPADAPSPRDLFARNVRGLVHSARRVGADVLLVPEATTDPRGLWRVAFRDVMQSTALLGEARCVDPAAALSDAGGEALFMDEVHLRPRGHAVVAEALAPTLAELLRAR